MSHLIIKAKPFSDEQKAQISCELIAKYNGKLTTRTTSRHITSWFIKDIDISQDKVNSWITKLEKTFKLVIPSNTITILNKE